MINPRTVGNAYLRALVHLVERRGIAPSHVLAGVPLGADELHAPLGRVPVAVACRL